MKGTRLGVVILLLVADECLGLELRGFAPTFYKMGQQKEVKDRLFSPFWRGC